jgi:deoxyhypusine synthase
MAVKAANTGMIILGGGVIKHHICNANLMVSSTNTNQFRIIPSLFYCNFIEYNTQCSNFIKKNIKTIVYLLPIINISEET